MYSRYPLSALILGFVVKTVRGSSDEAKRKEVRQVPRFLPTGAGMTGSGSISLSNGVPSSGPARTLYPDACSRGCKPNG